MAGAAQESGRSCIILCTKDNISDFRKDLELLAHTL